MLIGRRGRLGDPGTYRQFVALDDEIRTTGFGPKKSDALRERGVTRRHFSSRTTTHLNAGVLLSGSTVRLMRRLASG